MKCGGKRSSTSASRASIISRVFQVSWFSKFKQKCSNPETNSANEQLKDKVDFPTPNSSVPAVWREARFYRDDEDDAYWRLSFRKETTEGKRGIIGISSLRYDSDYEFQVPVSGFKSFGSREIEERYKEKIMQENDAFRKDKLDPEAKFTTPIKKRRSRKRSPRVAREDYVFAGRVSISEWRNRGNKKSNEINHKIETQKSNRISHCRKLKQNGAKDYSQKTECKIRVLEDMKKERMRLKRMRTKEQMMESRTMYDNFAEVKSSFNPQRDFRDSMVEMMREKRIRRPTELEELLACYLTLNCDEYHELIIGVFQQVWFELSRGVY